MRVIETQMIETKVVMDVLCDRCGKSCMTQLDEGPPPLRQPELGTFKASWGWDSNHDLESWTCVLCESCCEEFKTWVDVGEGQGMEVTNAY